MYSQRPKAKRVEFRCPDPLLQSVPGFAAMLMAGLDGIQNRIDPGQPLDKNIYDLPPEELAKVPQAPGSLNEALDALEADHDFLLKGDVFTEEVISTWIEYKRAKEVGTDVTAATSVRVLPVLRRLGNLSRLVGKRKCEGPVCASEPGLFVSRRALKNKCARFWWVADRTERTSLCRRRTPARERASSTMVYTKAPISEMSPPSDMRRAPRRLSR